MSLIDDIWDPGIKVDVLYCGKKLPSIYDGSELVKNYISRGKPFAVSRFGETEHRVVHYGLTTHFPILNPLKKRRILREDCANWCEGAGFFPKKINYVPRFLDIYINAFQEIDLLGVWGLEYEPFLIERFFADKDIIRAKSLYSQELENPWTELLEGKKILVISPFAKSIEKQYEKRRYIHENPKMLPDFELKTLVAVQSPYILGGSNGYKNWFDALEKMFEQTTRIEYDIALLGCGAYALPLASMIKKSGHGAITTCGSTQLLFGIMGNRWDYAEYRKQIHVNEFWTRPSDEEIPKNKKMVENGCYW